VYFYRKPRQEFQTVARLKNPLHEEPDSALAPSLQLAPVDLRGIVRGGVRSAQRNGPPRTVADRISAHANRMDCSAVIFAEIVNGRKYRPSNQTAKIPVLIAIVI
jgi:hypothetical protein